jgi:hypothetical protein
MKSTKSMSYWVPAYCMSGIIPQREAELRRWPVITVFPELSNFVVLWIELALLFCFWGRVLLTLPWLASNSWSFCLYLLSSWVYSGHDHSQLAELRSFILKPGDASQASMGHSHWTWSSHKCGENCMSGAESRTGAPWYPQRGGKEDWVGGWQGQA